MSVRKGSYVIAGTPRTTGGVEIGDMGFAPLGIDESLNLRRYLNGQVISQSQFVSFTNKVKSAVALFPSLATTEENWQSEKSLSKFGQVGKFVIDDTAGTIRLPAVVNAQGLLGLSGIGNLVNESLPNITGDASLGSAGQNSLIVGHWSGTGFFSTRETTDGPVVSSGGTTTGATHRFLTADASRSSSTYQNNAPVQQEAVQYPYYIQVATGVEETLPAIREYNINTPFFFGQSMYSDIAPDNASWLASNGQYNARAVYPDYYDWLVEQMNAGVSGFVASTATYTDYDFVINTTDQTFRLPLLNGEEDLPGNKHEILTYTSDKTYVAPANGWFSCYGTATAASAGSYNLLIKQTSGERDTKYSVTSNTRLDVSLEVSRGQSVYALSQNLTIEDFRFIYAQGNGNLYFYVGDTVQDASLINAGAVLGQLATKTNSVEAAAASMPSSRYIDLTLGATGSTYTAPANGYFVISKDFNASNQFVVLYNQSNMLRTMQQPGAPSGNASCIMPAKKGQNVLCEYSLGGSTSWFRFVYAEGEQNV